MAVDWLLEAAALYNEQSLEGRDGYPAHILMPVDTLAQILDWTFQSLPDEILVGMDGTRTCLIRERSKRPTAGLTSKADCSPARASSSVSRT